MRALFRVDPRLVHATMTNVWVPTFGARTLVIGDKTLVDNPKRRAILEMSAMGLIDVLFSDEAALAEALASIGSQAPVIVLFSTLESAETAVRAGLNMPRLNVGHVPESPERKKIHAAVHLGAADFDVIDRLQALGVEVFIQPLPTEKETIIPRNKSAAEPEAPKPAPPSVATASMRVVNDRGLHLRAAHVLAHLATRLPAQVTVTLQGNAVNAKSLLGLTTLGATCGTLLEVCVDGPDAEAGLAEIQTLFDSGFDEGRHWVGDAVEGRSA